MRLPLPHVPLLGAFPIQQEVRFVSVSIILSLVLLCSGCFHNLGKPSKADRELAYATAHGATQGLEGTLWEASFCVLNFRSAVPDSAILLSGASFSLDLRYKDAFINAGMAVAIDKRGYLLTANHCAGQHMVLIGITDGQCRLFRPFVVKQAAARVGEEYALLQVTAPLQHALSYAPEPKQGARLYSLIMDDAAAGKRFLAAGTLLKITDPQSQEKISVIETSLPFWHGDSGGGVIDSEGHLVGIVTGGEWSLRWFRTHSSKLASRPPPQTLLKEIEALETIRNRAVAP